MSAAAEEFRKTILECKRCRLGESRKIAVPGAGCENARIMLVGEGPGKTEDETGQPFVGRAGELLDLMLDAVGLSRNTNVFITNIVKCRPPGNREPLPDEMDACLPYLRRQVLELKPAFIVCLGRVAACRLIDPDFKVTRQHGQFFHKNGLIFMGTLHPAALLRNPSLKPQAFSDWVELRNQIRQTCPEILDEADFV